ncbi:hypothetical protein G6L68_25525 [Agrobacterium fabrum]|uniref:hypothetical protein n=1 Tax=Agrobacterium fabrum TaxID=1176649 RepID=UPI000EF5C922|nr:hypothetical protein [Agrobacterium fabrum]AYM66148.1 hypothetical protein At12D13_49960 [Agrobacterium fabrum]NTE63996.1 hypothetical protein [Agrobacterium fabrum]
MFVSKTTLFASRLDVFEVTSFAVEGTDPATPWWFSFHITDEGSVSIHAFAHLTGVDDFDPIEFLIEDRDGLDPAVLNYYRGIGGSTLKMASFVGKLLPEAIRRWHQDNTGAAA